MSIEHSSHVGVELFRGAGSVFLIAKVELLKRNVGRKFVQEGLYTCMHICGEYVFLTRCYVNRDSNRELLELAGM